MHHLCNSNWCIHWHGCIYLNNLTWSYITHQYPLKWLRIMNINIYIKINMSYHRTISQAVSTIQTQWPCLLQKLVGNSHTPFIRGLVIGCIMYMMRQYTQRHKQERTSQEKTLCNFFLTPCFNHAAQGSILFDNMLPAGNVV